MTWLVVKFIEENSVEAVPRKWFIKSTEMCYWPPKSYKETSILEMIKQKKSPDQTNWKSYPATILGSYGDFKTANKKANKAKTMTDLSSNGDAGKGKKKILKKKKITQYSSSSDSDNVRITDLSDDNNYPALPELSEGQRSQETDLIVIPSAETLVSLQECDSRIQELGARTTLPIVDTPKINSRTEFEKQVLRELNLLNIKMNDIQESMAVLLSGQRLKDISVVDTPPDIMQLLPLKNVDELFILENWLEITQQREILAKELSRLGGNDAKEITRRIMYRVLSNEIGNLYSWDGAKKKEPFKQLKLSTTILLAVRLNRATEHCTEVEVISFIKLWLVRSKDRLINEQKKMHNKENQIINVEQRDLV